jgi:recombination protein RecA
MAITQDKIQKIEALLQKTDKNYGKGTVQFGGRDIESYPTICSSGSLKLDIALGIMGIPKGRIIEVYGPESGGKTTLTLHIIRECQKVGGIAAFVDVEHAMDSLWAAKLGVNPKELIFSQPDSAEEALSVVEDCVTSGAVDIIIVDSVAALVPKAEIAGEMGDSHMGLQARLMGQALRKLTGIVSKSNCTVIFINQIRMKIGVMFGCVAPDTSVEIAM